MRSRLVPALRLLAAMVALVVALSATAFRWHDASYPASTGSTTPSSPPALQDPAQGKALYDQKCAGCHTIGGGRTAGPDLKGVTDGRPRDWLVRFITNPAQLHSQGDPIARQLQAEYGMQMPNVGVTEAQVADILAYIQAESGGAGSQPAPSEARAAQPVAGGNISAGYALFVGTHGFSNGGPACMGCHNVAGLPSMGGGTLGVDLTATHTKYGAAGLPGVIKAPAFPGMKEAYQSRPVTDAEAADLVAFFAGVADRPWTATNRGTIFPLLGFAVFLALAGVSHLVWSGHSRRAREPWIGR